MIAARVVQLTDTHFSAAAGVPPQWPATLKWLRSDPPDVVVHSGDIVLEDPDDDGDRDFARRLLDDVPAPLLCIPGNHDIGFYGDELDRPRRLAVFRETWGSDRFSVDVGPWRIIGVNAYLLGDRAHDAWLRDVSRGDRALLVFIHQPVAHDAADGWEMPGPARAAFWAALDGADLRVVASGHRHVAARFGAMVWAPSLTLVGHAGPGADPACGLVDYRLGPDRAITARVARPWAS